MGQFKKLTELFELPEARPGAAYHVVCPHPEHPGDGDANTSVRFSDKGYAVLECHSHGCNMQEALRPYQITTKRGRHSDTQWLVFDKGKRELGKLVATYPYVDESGQVLYQVERYQRPDGGKTFLQRMPDGTPKITPGTRRVLYHLPEVLAAAQRGDTVYVVEGEKDADRLRDMGVVATTCAQGAGKWQPSFSECLKGAHVIVIADKDEPGYRHARRIVQETAPYAASVKVLEAKTGKDVSEHLDAGHGLADLVESALEVAPHDYDPMSFFQPRGGLAAKKLLDAVLSFGPVVPDHTGLLWSYTDGVYRPDGEQVVKRRVVSLLQDHYRREYAGTIIDMLKSQEPAWTEDTIDSRYINTPNGLVDWRTGELLPHSPHVPSIVRIPVEWDPDAECPEIDRWIGEVFAPDCRDFVYEVVGYALLNRQPLHKAIMLYGTGRNGKGTFLRLLTALLGRENVSAIAPQDLDENRFTVAQLYGKLANICGDVNARTFRETAKFKQVTGEDNLHAERKGQDGFHFTVRALLVAAFNEFPRTNDTTEGYFSRWIVVPFDRRFSDSEADRTLDSRLQAPEELQGLLVKAVRGLRRLMERGSFAEPPSVRAKTAEFRRNTDPVQAFLAETVRPEPGGFVKRSDLYARYEDWVAENTGGRPLGKKKFFERVVSAGSALFDTEVREVKRRGDYGYPGFDWRATDDDGAEEQSGGKIERQGAKFGHFQTGRAYKARSNGNTPDFAPSASKMPPATTAAPFRGLPATVDLRTGKPSTDDAPWRRLYRQCEHNRIYADCDRPHGN